MIMRRNLYIFGGDFNLGMDSKHEALEDKGFVSSDEEEDKMVTRLGRQVRKTWKRWITVT
jgi:hypothetical protein